LSDRPQDSQISAKPIRDVPEAPLPTEPGQSRENYASSVMGRIVRFFLCACLVGGLLPVSLIVILAVSDPNSFRLGGGMWQGDISGTVLAISLVVGIAGLLVGAVVGVIGGVVIANRR
jgi:hypothetical protein